MTHPKGVDRAIAPNGGPAEERSKLMSYGEARGPPLLNESSRLTGLQPCRKWNAAVRAEVEL